MLAGRGNAKDARGSKKKAKMMGGSRWKKANRIAARNEGTAWERTIRTVPCGMSAK